MNLTFLGRPQADMEVAGSMAEAIVAASPDIVINAAAYTAVDQAENEPERAFRINTSGAGEVAEAARQCGAQIIHISTDYVFDGQAEAAYAEDAPVNPLGVYGATKLAGEEEVRLACPDHLIVRTAWVYSPFGRNFVRTMLTAARTLEVLTVVDDQRGNPTSALDLADAILVLTDCVANGRSEILGHTYHVAGSGQASWFEVAAIVMKEARRLNLPSADVQPIHTAEWPTRAKRPSQSILDCRKFAEATGFIMPDWQFSVAATVARIAANA